MTEMLENNKHMLKQITTLSTLMVDLSSCIKFDRYRGYDSAEELNAVAHDLAKNRDLYASKYNRLILSSRPIGRCNIHSQPAMVSSLLEWILVDFTFS